MADCPGVMHLAAMADGGLARLRASGGALTAAQLRAVADAAEALGSGVVDLTNRANLQIRGLQADAGPALAARLETAGFRFHGEADRRRNILLDPFSGLDPQEARDLRPLGAELEARLVAAPWIGELSPKFSFSLDGGGASAIGAIASDVTVLAHADGLTVSAGGRTVSVADEDAALVAMMAVAEAVGSLEPDARAADLDLPALHAALGGEACESAAPGAANPRFGPVATGAPGLVAVSFPAPVGRLDVAMLRFLAEEADAEGDGRLVLAPWSAAVAIGVRTDRAAAMLARSERAGFASVDVARRLQVVACAGAPACPRALEPAKRLGAEILALAAAEPERLPPTPRRIHLSACPKGCAGGAPADLLLLGESRRPGWSVHENATPRRPGRSGGRIESATAAEALDWLAR